MSFFCLDRYGSVSWGSSWSNFISSVAALAKCPEVTHTNAGRSQKLCPDLLVGWQNWYLNYAVLGFDWIINSAAEVRVVQPVQPWFTCWTLRWRLEGLISAAGKYKPGVTTLSCVQGFLLLSSSVPLHSMIISSCTQKHWVIYLPLTWKMLWGRRITLHS